MLYKIIALKIYFDTKINNINLLKKKVQWKKITYLLWIVILIILASTFLIYNILFLIQFCLYIFYFLIHICYLKIFSKDRVILLEFEYKPRLTSYILLTFFVLPKKYALLFIYGFLTRSKLTFDSIKILFFTRIFILIFGFPIWVVEVSLKWAVFLVQPLYLVNWKQKNKRRWFLIYLEELQYSALILFSSYVFIEKFLYTKKIWSKNGVLFTNGLMDRFIFQFTYKNFLIKNQSLIFYKEKETMVGHKFIPFVTEFKDEKVLGITETSKSSIRINKESAAILNDRKYPDSESNQYVRYSLFNTNKIETISMSKIAQKFANQSEGEIQYLNDRNCALRFAKNLKDNPDTPIAHQYDKKLELITYSETRKKLSKKTIQIIEESVPEWEELFEKEVTQFIIDNQIEDKDRFSNEAKEKLLVMDKLEMCKAIKEAAEINNDDVTINAIMNILNKK